MKAKGKINIYKRSYRCHHNTYPRSETANARRGSKNTDCPAVLTITIKRTDFKKGKSRSSTPDPFLPEYPCEIILKNTHNHAIESADSLRERDVSEETKQLLKDLFGKGHSPSSALETIKTDLQIAEGDNYAFAAADRAKCPDLGYCYRLYYKIFAATYGAPTGEQMLKDLERLVSQFNTERGDKCAKVSTLGKDLVVAICTPLMKRAHILIQQSGELVFVDASGGVDRHHCRIFLLLTHSSAGGVPLGCFIITSEAREVISAGLQLLRDILPEGAFFGNGNKGPVVFLTDDSSAERSAIQDCYPDSALLLCIFHLLQANWRYLWEAKNAIAKPDRPHLLALLKAMVYAKNEDALQEKYEALAADDIAQKYEGYLRYMEGIFDRRKEWAICLREDLPTRGNHTNNFVEAAMRVLKDKIFVRTRAFNVVQLVDFMLTRFEMYYERRFMDIANNRFDMTISKRFFPDKQNISKQKIKQVSNTVFSVSSETKEEEYLVDTELCLCTCYVGNTCAPCKHQYAVVKFFGVDSVNFVPVNSPELRKKFLQLATGNTTVPEGWFSSLRSVPHVQPMEGVIEQTTEEQNASLNEATTAFNGDDDGGDKGQSPMVRDNEPASWSLEQQRQLQNKFLERSNSRPSSKSSEPELHNEITTVTEQIMLAAAGLCQRVKSNNSLVPSAKKFLKTFDELQTDSALDSALACFGKYSGLNVSHKSRKIIRVQALVYSLQLWLAESVHLEGGNALLLVEGQSYQTVP